MSAQPHRESTRRANAAPANAAAVKEEPLTWEEEELAAYEPKRTKAVEELRRAEAKMALLARQLPLQWKALREILVIRCESVNARGKTHGPARLRSRPGLSGDSPRRRFEDPDYL